MIKVEKEIKIGDKKHIIQSCTDCGAMLYSKDVALEQCPVCNNHMYDMADLDADARKFKRMLEKNECVRLPRAQVGAYWVLEYVTYNTNGLVKVVDKQIIRCKKCGAIKIVDADTKIDDVVCNTCRFKLASEKTKEAGTNWERALETAKRAEAISNKKKELEQAVAEAAENEKKTEKDSTLYRMRQSIKKINPKLDIVGKYVHNGVHTVQLACSVCGSLDEVYAKGSKDLKNYECKGCKIRKENSNYTGVLKRSLVGTTKNLFTVIRDKGKTVDVKCRCCGKIVLDQSKLKFISGESRHDCERRTVEAICEVCGRLVEVKVNNLKPDTTHIECPSCKAKIPKFEFENELHSMDAKLETRDTLEVVTRKIADSVEVKGSIAKAKSPLYVDQNGEKYFNCRCIEHHQNFIAKYDDIEAYSHQFCNNLHQLFVSNKDINALTFIKKVSVSEKE